MVGNPTIKVHCAKYLNTLMLKRFTSICSSLNSSSSAAKMKANAHAYQKADKVQKSLWENILPSTIPNQIKSIGEWKHIRDQLLQAEQEITPVSIDSVILSYCIKNTNYRLAYSYLEYLKSMNIKLNLAVMGKYFKVFYLSNSDKLVNEKEEEYIFNMYKEVRKAYNVLDSSTCENVILALSLTKHWQEGLKLLDEIKISCMPNSIPYSAIVVSAFKNNNSDLGWSLLEEMIDNDRMPLDIFYSSYLKHYKTLNSKVKFMKNFETLLEFFRLHNVQCTSDVASVLSETCKEFKIAVSKTGATNRGICMNCQQKLQKLTLNEQDFENLKQAIFEKVIIGKNVFYKTTPAEVERFTTFVKDMEKYDVVVDGLNVAYCAGTKHSAQILSKFVIAVVHHFVNQNKKVLLLGRTHMSSWPNWQQVTDNSDTFLTQSLSQDDPYLLYCALNSGLNTVIVSGDLMRSHLFRLKDPHLKIMFSHWLNQSQHQVRYIDNNGKVFLKYPLPFLRITQNNNGYWHVPYNEDSGSKWLCIHS